MGRYLQYKGANETEDLYKTSARPARDQRAQVKWEVVLGRYLKPVVPCCARLWCRCRAGHLGQQTQGFP